MGSAFLGHLRNIFFSVFCFVFCYLIGSLVDENTIGQGQTSLVMIAMFISFAVHIVLYIPSYIFQTEKFYDLTGSFTYFLTLSAVLYLKYLAVSSNLELRSILIYACVMIWTIRLGSFLFWRVLKDGEDKRFRSILPNFSQLFMTWMLSATWVFIQSLTALVAITTLNKADFGLLGALGLIIWVMGFSPFDQINKIIDYALKCKKEKIGFISVDNDYGHKIFDTIEVSEIMGSIKDKIFINNQTKKDFSFCPSLRS